MADNPLLHLNRQEYFAEKIKVFVNKKLPDFLLSEAQPKNALVNPPPQKKPGNDCQHRACVFTIFF
jgi:hypothetical protein